MHPAVSFFTAAAADREDRLDGTIPSKMKPLEIAAVIEVANHLDVANVIVEGRDGEGILVVSFTQSLFRVIDPMPMPYDTLYVYKDGKIAEAALNQPIRHRTFRELVEDVRIHANIEGQS